MTDQMWLFVVGQLATAGGVYAAIRADLQEFRYRLNQIEKKIGGVI